MQLSRNVQSDEYAATPFEYVALRNFLQQAALGYSFDYSLARQLQYVFPIAFREAVHPAVSFELPTRLTYAVA